MSLSPPIEPALTKLEPHLPLRGRWVYEPKLDGFRGIMFCGTSPSVWSRNRKNLGPRFPELIELASSLPRCVLDGEIIAVRDGILDFEALQARLVGAGDLGAAFVPFDLLELNGQRIMDDPLAQRRSALVELPIEPIPQTLDGDAAGAWMDELDRGIEGVVAKRADEPYRPGVRSWVKVKASRTTDLVIGGVTQSFGLLLGAYGKDGRFHHVGTTSPLARAHRDQLAPVIEQLKISDSFDGISPELNRWSSNRVVHWQAIAPQLVVEVSYSRIDSGRIRHAARFVRFRPDKVASECTIPGRSG